MRIPPVGDAVAVVQRNRESASGLRGAQVTPRRPAAPRGPRAKPEDPWVGGPPTAAAAAVARYCTSSKILNIGRYIEMTTTPTMQPTPIIIIGSMIEVSDFSIVATSSS